MAERPWRRKRFYIHPIQRKYFLLSLVPLIFYSFLILFFLFLPLDLLFFSEASSTQKAAVLWQLRALGVRVWPAVLLSMLLSAVLSIFVTHKFAGPLYRFEEMLRRMAEGDFVQRVKLRKGDELRELEEILNRFLSHLSSAIADLREREAAVQEKLDALLVKLKAGEVGKAELLADLEKLRARQQEALEVLGWFRIPGP